MAEDQTRQTELSLTMITMPKGKVHVRRLDAYEALSQPFSISLDVISEHEIELLPNLGLPATITCSLDGNIHRYYHGIVTDACFVENLKKNFRLYRLTLSPITYFLEHGSNFRIFQDMPAVDVIKKVLTGLGLNFELKERGKSRKLEYCVQYGESDFAFACRLMEEEGFYYFYQHEENAHKLMIQQSSADNPDLPFAVRFNAASGSLVLGDSKVRFTAFRKPEIQQWQEYVSSGAEGRAVMRDYNFENPSDHIEVIAQEKQAHGLDAVEVYQWPGRYSTKADGEQVVGVLFDSRRAQRVRYEASSRFVGFQAGFVFRLEDHPTDRFNSKYLITACRTHVAAEHYDSGMEGDEGEVSFTAIPYSVRFRAPIVTPRPVTRGPETAFVVGPKGEEIYVDKYGRIKVQFHWDREGKHDENSSCWIRVSQTGGLGNMIIPRIGHEVIIDFINGNPDRPIVVGRVYNAGHMPTYKLPDNKTMALWRSKTYMQDGGVPFDDAKALDTEHPGANEIRFEDKTGHEELFFHAEKNMTVRVRYCETHHVGKDVHLMVGHSRTKFVGGSEKTEVKGNRTEDVGGKETVTVVGERKVEIKDKDELTVKNDIKVKSELGAIEVEAMNSITLKVGGSKIVVDQAGVSIEGMMIKINGQITTEIKGLITQISGSAMLTEKGGIIMIN